MNNGGWHGLIQHGPTVMVVLRNGRNTLFARPPAPTRPPAIQKKVAGKSKVNRTRPVDDHDSSSDSSDESDVVLVAKVRQCLDQKRCSKLTLDVISP